jgi:AcrR family transcriptional regulator
LAWKNFFVKKIDNKWRIEYNEYILNEFGVNKMSNGKRREQREQTRKHLIEVAFRQFAENGLMSTRTLDIAQAAGVAHGTVFAHFPTREALLNSVIEEFGNRVTRRIHELSSGVGSVRAVLEAHLNGVMEYEPLYTRLVTERPLLPEEIRHSLVMIQSAISFHLQQVAEAEMIAGKIRRLPLHLFFNTWLGLIHYYLANGDLFSPGESVLKRYGPGLVDYFLDLTAIST